MMSGISEIPLPLSTQDFLTFRGRGLPFKSSEDTGLDLEQGMIVALTLDLCKDHEEADLAASQNGRGQGQGRRWLP